MLEDCKKLFDSCICVSRQGLTALAKLAASRMCRKLLELDHTQVLRCVPRGGAPCVAFYYEHVRTSHVIFPPFICSSQGGNFGREVRTVLRCTRRSRFYHDGILLRCFNRRSNGGYLRYSMYQRRGSPGAGRTKSRVPRLVLGLLDSKGGRPIRSFVFPNFSERRMIGALRGVLRRRVLFLRGKAVSLPRT